MHIVVMAWLFVIGTMALTWTSVLGGVAFFAAVGVAPVALCLWIAVRRLRARAKARAAPPARPSASQDRVRGGDHADAGRDQQ